MGSFLYFIGSRFLSGNSTSDTKVTQTEDISTNADYEVLSSGTGDNTTRTEESHKSANLTYNPSSSKLTVKDNNGQVGFSVNNRAASRSMTVTESDVTMSGNQYWDGENQSLKTAVNTKVKKEVSNGSTSVTNYFSSPYTLLSALPFGDSSLRLDDGTLFVHKDEQIESTAMVLYNNGIQCYLLSVDGQTGEVTNATGIGSWMLNQVGLSVMDIWRNGDSGWVGSDHSLSSVLSSLNTSLANKAAKAWSFVGWAYAGSKVTVSQSFNEAMIYVAGNYNNSYRVAAEGIYVPRMWEEQINGTLVMSLGGYHLTNTDHGYIAVTITNNGKSFECRSLTWGNQNLSNKYVMVFIR